MCAVRISLPPTLALICVVTLGCSSPESEPAASPEPDTDLTTELQSLVDAAVSENESIHGAALYVSAPGLGVAFEGASGEADPSNGTPMGPDRPVRIASNTKTYTAATVLRLTEEGMLNLDDPISLHLTQGLAETLRADGYDIESTTVKQLLTHTAGIFDHSDVPSYIEAILADPTHVWTRQEQVDSAMAWGDPLGAPGEIYRYSDTGYVILGGIIAHASGQPMAQAVREMIDFDRLGLTSTWWEKLEDRPAGVPDRAHQFLGEIDTYDFDPSLDLYGGGGLVATVGDMGRFMRALFTGDVYSDPDTADTMLTTLEDARPSGEEGQLAPGMYRMGVWVLEVDGHESYRHAGFWGTVASYVPELDLVVAATVNQNHAGAVLYKLAEDSIGLVAETVTSTNP